MNILLACLLAYLIGTIPYGGNRKKIHHPEQATFQMIRIQDAMIHLALDILKGAIAVGLAWLIGGLFAAHLAILFVVLGELCPFFPSRHPRNGFGVAAGGFLVVSPILILISVSVYIISLLILRYTLWSTGFALLAFVICLVLFATHLYVWLVVLGVGCMLFLCPPYDFKRSKRKKSWRLPRWKKRRWGK